jgi:hypothetical protein
METITTEFDASSTWDKIEKSFENLNVIDALFQFAFIHKSRSKQEIVDEENKFRRNSVISSLFNHEIVGYDGRYKVNIPSSFNTSLTLEDKNIELYIIGNLYMHIGLEIELYLSYAFTLLTSKYYISKNQLYYFISDNPIIEEDRTNILLTGLYYGFRREFIISNHILMPQIEFMLRLILYKMGHPTLTINNKLKNEELITLNSMINKYENELTSYFGEGLFLEIKYLFNDSRSYNYRNDLLHGNYDDTILNSQLSLYMFMIMFKIIVHGKLNTIK